MHSCALIFSPRDLLLTFSEKKDSLDLFLTAFPLALFFVSYVLALTFLGPSCHGRPSLPQVSLPIDRLVEVELFLSLGKDHQ